MQRDKELFASYDSSTETKPIFFFYTWNEPAITIGKIQRNREQLISEAETLGIPCYLRPTGGRAVLHGGDICYTFIGVQSDPEFGGTLQESFKKVNQTVIRLINAQLSVIASQRSWRGDPISALEIASSLEPTASAAWLAPRHYNADSFNCFSTYVSNEGLFNGHKIIGAAQAMGSRSFIQQGSIQLNKVDIHLDYFQSYKVLGELTQQQYNLGKLSRSLNIIQESVI